MGLTNMPSAYIARMFGNPDTRKTVERGLRAVMRESINKVNKITLKFSGYVGRQRMEGLTYIRTRKSRPNVPDNIRGTTKLQAKDLRLTGKFTGQVGLPLTVQQKINVHPITPRLLGPFNYVKTPVTHPANLLKGALRG